MVSLVRYLFHLSGLPIIGRYSHQSSPITSLDFQFLDYGQVKALSKEDRLLMCKIIIALADENKAEVIRLMKEAGYKSQNMVEDIIYLYAKVSYDEDNDELTGGKHIQLFMEDIQAKDPIEALPKDFIMVGRIRVMLRGLGHALHQPRSVAKAWKPIAERVLQEDI